jgi:hypothetical protein
MLAKRDCDQFPLLLAGLDISSQKLTIGQIGSRENAAPGTAYLAKN